MPATLTYPGVYIEEVPSGVRTIVGVATSITAFIGRARFGPVDDPVTINNFGDFERIFGGLGFPYPMSYAVRDFFVNGGGQAIVVRLFKAPTGGGGSAEIDANGLALAAASPGSWANTLRARVDHDVPSKSVAEQRIEITGGPTGGSFTLTFKSDTTAAITTDGTATPTSTAIQSALEALASIGAGKVTVAGVAPAGPFTVKFAADLAANAVQLTANPANLTGGTNPSVTVTVPAPHPLPWVDASGLSSNDLFNLTVRDTAAGVTETFLNLTVVGSPRRVDRVLAAESNFMRVKGNPPTSRPTADGNIDPKDPGAAWSDDTLSSPVKTEGGNGGALDQAAYEGSRNGKTGLFALELVPRFDDEVGEDSALSVRNGWRECLDRSVDVDGGAA